MKQVYIGLILKWMWRISIWICPEALKWQVAKHTARPVSCMPVSIVSPLLYASRIKSYNLIIVWLSYLSYLINMSNLMQSICYKQLRTQ